MHDAKMRATVRADPQMATAWYLMAGYAYEVLDAPILTDGAWDELCRFTAENLEAARQHRHGHLIDAEALTSATAGYLREDYLPSITKSAALRLANEVKRPKRRKARSRC
ncbi:hypothetical protein [Brevundimonas diminuta]|uniref:hypothetical protein n=1 Tax=Brevundimonas diminuta TaxID=293 RepID=UPI001906DB3E|nr:hypothetical protein [Brevundimonas diminuta]